MRSLAHCGVLIAALLLVGCAHHITITPPLTTLDVTDIVKIDKTVAYYISPADRAKEVTTPGGGGDKVTYLPYLQSESALKRVLSNVFTKVVAIPSLDDKRFIADNRIAYIFVPTMYTNSSSDSAFTWPPTRVTFPPSARQYSASISGKCWFTMYWIPTVLEPSSPDSARKITSRSSGTFKRLSSSIVISAAVTLSLSSTEPRP